jgi:hypothetical protein
MARGVVDRKPRYGQGQDAHCKCGGLFAGSSEIPEGVSTDLQNLSVDMDNVNEIVNIFSLHYHIKGRLRPDEETTFKFTELLTGKRAGQELHAAMRLHTPFRKQATSESA